MEVGAWWGDQEWGQKLQEKPKAEAGVQVHEPEWHSLVCTHETRCLYRRPRSLWFLSRDRDAERQMPGNRNNGRL